MKVKHTIFKSKRKMTNSWSVIEYWERKSSLFKVVRPMIEDKPYRDELSYLLEYGRKISSSRLVIKGDYSRHMSSVNTLSRENEY